MADIVVFAFAGLGLSVLVGGTVAHLTRFKEW
jgi:hypothetical protein